MTAGTDSENRLVVISNRLPFTLKRSGEGWRTERSTGGLATAMSPLLQKSRGIWIGWSGEASGATDDKRRRLLSRWAERDRYFAVDLSPEVAKGFYEGFANQTLWPLFHHFPSLLHFTPDHWQAYVEANERFRDVALEHLRPGDLVWIHDYQLMLLPQLLREAAPDARIGFFLHIPFPTSAVFRLLPRREELLRGLLGADYLAFHTYSYLQHFRSSALRILGLESSMDRLATGGRSVRLAALPIGIAPEDFSGPLESDAETIRRVAEIRERFANRKLLLGVDRLDYTKGIPERLRTFRRLAQSPDLRGQVVLVQVAVPSREVIPMYRELRAEVDQLVGKINGELSTPDWTPIVYLRRGIPRSELAALYRAADLAWVAPLRDGLNLVTKEYVASQGENAAGVLVLSEFAGAAAEMGEAFLVNPYDEERTAEVVARALALPEDERRERMSALDRRVRRNDVFNWSRRFLSGLREAAESRVDHPSAHPARLDRGRALRAYLAADRRQLLLDYDGTLAPYAARPQDALPPGALLDVLAKLAGHKANTVALVSGRSRDNLEAWFGHVEGLWLAAEHGAVMRSPVARQWEVYRPSYSSDWKQQVYPVLEHYMDRTPGSFIEEKEFSLVWHYRMSDPEFGEWLANELVANLEQMLAETELRAFRGRKSVEVKFAWANKGEVLSRLSEAAPAASFCLAAGDDRTDEDLFACLPADAWSIRVGGGASRARFSLTSPAELRELLDQFVEAEKTGAVGA